MNKNQTGNVDPEITDEEVLELDENETDVEAIKAHAKKVEDQNKQLYARTKKAEGFEQDKDGKWVKPAKPVEKPKPDASKTETSNDNLSSMDVITLMNAKVPQEDIADVLEYAQFKKISIAEALQAPVIKQVLADKLEERTIAEGTNTNGGRRGSGKVSDETLLQNAQKGVMPETDADMARLITLRKGKK